MNKKSYLISLLLASILGGFVAVKLNQYLQPKQTIRSIQDRQNIQLANFLKDSTVKVPKGLNFVIAANAVKSAVVHIKTTYAGKGKYSSSSSDPLEDMFRQFHGEDNYRRRHRRPRQSSGSGVIITDNGYVATNYHVIENAGQIDVVLNDKRSYVAKLVGKDPTTDLALLKIQEKNLPFVKYGNSGKTQIGEWVLAVGNPFDLTSTVTAGIVSAKGRNINILSGQYAIESFIQTDAAVNPGNSGGALVNLKGELVGINTAIATRTGSYSGYSFAIPVNIVKKVLNDLMKYGQTQRALLGVSIQNVDANFASNKDLSVVSGVYIATLTKSGAARSAGLKIGDVIIKIDDQQVRNMADLQSLIATRRPGDQVKVTYARGERVLSTMATLRNRQGNFKIMRAPRKIATEKILGAVFEGISLSEKTKLKIDHGVKVIDAGKGKLKESGIRKGFIITYFGEESVNSPKDIERLIKKRKRVIAIEGMYPNGEKAYYAIGW
ncbi:trypsin-like peptidase domain-containing protein [uncultured Microscilla sp.]|uniref:trypsin-like peptidase domain-containing protein n=1 Tax=uncultured Microscilla sp. TaxID=432653 RepID=UPI002624FB35|nr:trypsin-like peptidase domain-containing protein [uncultured Microscilla sp.]